MTARRTVLLTALVAVAVIFADQLTKAIVRAEISRVEQVELILGIKLVYTRNTGVAFSMLSGVRRTINNQLRTGTDKGNLTV